MEHLITPIQAADLLGISLPTVYTWVSRKRIRYVKVGAALRFRPSSLEDWLRKREYFPPQAILSHKTGISDEGHS